MAETFTLNYNWTKPEVGASFDVWGGFINGDLDGIDTTVKAISNAVPAASSTTPPMDGAGTPGAASTFARGDHQHPTDTSRYAASNPSGYQTAAQVTTSLGAYLPLAGGIMTGSLTLNGNPGSALQAATKQYADLMAPLAGATMTGPLTLAADPTTALQAATKQYADASGGRGFRNRIINGSFTYDQRRIGAAFTPTTGSYTADRWLAQANVSSKFSCQAVNSGSALLPVAFPTFGAMKIASLSTYTPAAGNVLALSQNIEWQNIADIAWSTAQAQPLTLSFWIQVSVAGVYSGSIQSWASSVRSYIFATPSLLANTPTFVTIPIPADSVSWVPASGGGAGGGMTLNFDLGSGTTGKQSTIGWKAGQFVGLTTAVNLVATNAATMYLSGVRLTVGNVAAPFEEDDIGVLIQKCIRYYAKSNLIGDAPGAANQNGAPEIQYPTTGAGGVLWPIYLQTRMRATPAITLYSPNTGTAGKIYTNTGDVTPNVVNAGDSSFTIGNLGGLSLAWAMAHWTADAEL